MKSAIELVARAFDDDPFYRWLFRRRRLARLRALMTLALRRSQLHHEPGALMAWQSPEVAHASVGFSDLVPAARIASAVGAWRRLVTAARVYRALSHHHPAGPHIHLELLAVAPEQQGRGIARRLLDGLIERADASAWPIVLETTNPINPPLYRRFGFETIAELQIGDAPPAWVMLRGARLGLPSRETETPGFGSRS